MITIHYKISDSILTSIEHEWLREFDYVIQTIRLVFSDCIACLLASVRKQQQQSNSILYKVSYYMNKETF